MNGAGRYEADYLIELISGAVNQKEVFLRQKPVSWQWIYKMSDYHHVSNLVYYKILWADSREIKMWKDKFEERYRTAIRLQEKYKKIKEELEEELERKKVNALFLGEAAILPYYPQPEMRMPESLQILVMKNEMERIPSIMYQLDFEPEREGEKTVPRRYRRIPDIKVEFCEKLKFTDPEIEVRFSDFPKRVKRKDNRKYIRELEGEALYLYFICRMAERYAKGQAEIRDLVDFWILLSKVGHSLPWKRIQDEIEIMGIEVFSEYLVKLAGRWFGGLRFPEEAAVFSDMQAYIFSKGERARKENESILPLVKTVEDIYYRDLKKEERQKRRKWEFPSLNYMKGVYPVLEKYPYLLPVCWGIRRMKSRRYSHREEKKEKKETKET
ncbi:nucleotidyltransferase family protein [Mediterraneibacter sp. NSJ-55]|uniref:Nucleotidyltransferase family protein n=1 Tax=Mediterraneibacter hominis TaxID=2763054 RepID=A0A923LIE1_9FIRM|nr:nucleotidyltransferase family protein [Mediterraneibacter hominis]MBC5689368.1 nucleotidyltransferase family protein [Mediterraneibacter hominis]